VRKLWYAGAVVASGLVLVGATPAQADLLPGTGTAEQQADEQLADLLGQSNGINVQNPLRYSTLGGTPLGSRPVMQFKAGQNSPDLNPMLPGESAAEQRPDLPAADVVGGALHQAGSLSQQNATGLPIRSLPVSDLLGRLGFGGLLANGGASAVQRPTVRQAEAFGGGMPLLGGLGGMLPVNELPKSGDKPDVTGLPAGGLAVLPAATTPPLFGQNAPAAPAAADPAATTAEQPAADQDAAPDDPRLHEEPIDGEASHRQFSPDGRPVAGVDQQYK
jgi:hypothetical protein